MMPGENQSNAVPIAADAIVGKCQNCSVLHQSLTEYGASLVALKQKITVSDDAIRLQQQLEELQIQLISLQTKAADEELLRAELDKKKSQAYEQMSQQMDKLKQDLSKTSAENKRLEDQLNDIKELTETQALENAQLKREKAMIENNLLKTQASLKISQAQADQVEKLIEENTKKTSLKNSLEHKVKLLDGQISHLMKEKSQLERNVDDLQVQLTKLEREQNKERRSLATQASAPEEPKVDKEKIRTLLETLWACVQPEKQQAAILLHLPVTSSKKVLTTSPAISSDSGLTESSPSQSPTNRTLESMRHPTQTKLSFSKLKTSSHGEKGTKHQTSHVCPSGERQTFTPKKDKQSSKEQENENSSTPLDNPELSTEEKSTPSASPELSIEEILELYKPLPPCLSPLRVLVKTVESMETESIDGENHPKASHSLLPFQQQESLLTTSSASSHPKSIEHTKEDCADLPEIASGEVEQLSNGKQSQHLGTINLSGITEMEYKRHRIDEETHLQKKQKIEQEPAVPQLTPTVSSSASDITGLCEKTSTTAESQEPTPSASPNSGVNSTSETPHDTESPTRVSSELPQRETGEDLTASIEMDAVACPGDDSDVTLIPPDGRESLRENNSAVVSEEASAVPPDNSSTPDSKINDSLQNGKGTCTESGPEMGITHQEPCDLGLENQDTTLFKSQEEIASCLNVQQGSPCLSKEAVSSSIPVASTENGTSIQLDQKANLIEPQETATENKTALPSECSLDASHPGSVSPCKPSLLKKADEDHQKSVRASDEPPSTSHNHIETVNSESITDHRGPPPSDSQETETLDCESVKENTHSQSLLPPVTLPSLKTQEQSDHVSKDVSSENMATHEQTEQPEPDLMEHSDVEKTNNGQSPQDRMDSDDSGKLMKAGKLCVTSSVSQDNAFNGQNKSLDTCQECSEKQSFAVMTSDASLGSPATHLSPESRAQPPESISHLRSKMGPPLPPALTPLKATPPKGVKPINPMQAVEKISFPSPMKTLASPTSVQSPVTSNRQKLNSSSVSSPVSPNGVPSSPLQFGSATPKHAVPVPGRLPLTAGNSASCSSSSPSQENSMRILDTMYPELSARARTLSILRGNVSLNMCSSESGTSPTTSDTQVSGFKTVSSTSTAFMKTEMRCEKRPATNLPQPKNSKRLRLESCFPNLTPRSMSSSSSNSGEDSASPRTSRPAHLENEISPQLVEDGKPTGQTLIDDALTKIGNSCFDLLPVIRSHLHVGNLPKKPVLRQEEKEVISDIFQANLVNADDMISAISKKLKSEKRVLSNYHLQALCRVYTGICRQKRDWEKAHILAYMILTDFPDSAKLILFMVSSWPSVLSHSSCLCQAIHAVTRLKAAEDVLSCLSAYLGWEKSPPRDIDQLIYQTLSEIRSGSRLAFTKRSRYGDDLGDEAWERVFALELLCSHKKWKWTFENLLGKELWPLMNTWVTQPRDQQAPISDVTVATVLRLIGRLGVIGIKERCIPTVITVANVINTFGRHGHTEGVPWEVQLAAVYCIFDLSPSNPKQAMEALAGWRGETSCIVPPAVTSCLNQLASVCRQVK
ncbi:little elongation complex subunit 1 [Thalassophryne amazonica]|uniref:little elongation complex subunit 1 n=1 Tax=Thalassophryne amazonica TaxID=390379 RepID=UPI0014723E41|nr:little elongation complex subunit 1 [Thalassophryne amazonica]